MAVSSTARDPLYLGGRTEAQISAASARTSEAGEQLRAARLHTRTEAETSQIELGTARESYLTAARATESARTSPTLAQARFEGGLADNIEVVSAQQALAAAEALGSRYLYEFYIARAKLAKARGNLLSVFE